MKFQIGAMSVGDILDRGLKLLFSNLVAFYVIELIVQAPNIALQIFLPDFLASAQGAGPRDLMVMATVGVLGIILFVILGSIGSAAILYIISRDFVGQHTTIGAAFQFALARFPSLLITSLLMVLVMIVGFLLCFVPGIIFLVWYLFYGQVVVVEGVWGTNALARSKTLTEGYRWRIFGLLVLFFIILGIFGAAVGLVQEVVYPSYEPIPGPNAAPIDKNLPFDKVLQQLLEQVVRKPVYPNFYINTVVAQLVDILVQTYATVCITLLYFDLRIRKEGFDLELAARQQTASPETIQ